MGHDIHTFNEARALALRVWRNAAAFFLSIELALMLLVALSTVAGLFLAFMGDFRSILCFGFAIGYMAARTVLHLKRKLSWPYI